MRIYTVLLVILISGCTKGQTKSAINDLEAQSNGISQEQTDLIFELSKSFPNNTEIALALIKEGETSFYGIRRSQDTLRTVENKNKIYEIGSLTKVFTATLLANFVVDQKVHLEDPISDYIQINIEEPITLQQLANHTSGLPRLPSNLNLITADPDNPYKAYDKAKLNEYLNEEVALTTTPGTKYQYSNLGAGLLGYILSEKFTTPYGALLKEYIFDPYGMNATTTIKKDIETQLVVGLDKNGKETSNWDLNVLEGAGSILSSTEDLSKFALAQFDTRNNVFALTRNPTFSVNKSMDIGLGWHLLKTPSNDSWVWHNGGTGGYTSSMALDIEAENGVIILSNVSAFNSAMGNIDNLCFGLMKTLTK